MSSSSRFAHFLFGAKNIHIVFAAKIHIFLRKCIFATRPCAGDYDVGGFFGDVFEAAAAPAADEGHLVHFEEADESVGDDEERDVISVRPGKLKTLSRITGRNMPVFLS